MIFLVCSSCGKTYNDAKEKHTPKFVEESRGVMVIRYTSGCTVEKLAEKVAEKV